jgi:hypothetical protein
MNNDKRKCKVNKGTKTLRIKISTGKGTRQESGVEDASVHMVQLLSATAFVVSTSCLTLRGIPPAGFALASIT